MAERRPVLLLERSRLGFHPLCHVRRRWEGAIYEAESSPDPESVGSSTLASPSARAVRNRFLLILTAQSKLLCLRGLHGLRQAYIAACLTLLLFFSTLFLYPGFLSCPPNCDFLYLRGLTWGWDYHVHKGCFFAVRISCREQQDCKECGPAGQSRIEHNWTTEKGQQEPSSLWGLQE